MAGKMNTCTPNIMEPNVVCFSLNRSALVCFRDFVRAEMSPPFSDITIEQITKYETLIQIREYAFIESSPGVAIFFQRVRGNRCWLGVVVKCMDFSSLALQECLLEVRDRLNPIKVVISEDYTEPCSKAGYAIGVDWELGRLVAVPVTEDLHLFHFHFDFVPALKENKKRKKPTSQNPKLQRLIAIKRKNRK